ncbi:hypothetical protein HKT18_04415 [Flavobacterium sp. IMCC34852]|uniref:HEPN AbiJ-N-terminal domain-containing protein n=1 Tax=Flavobacterium rivulicola TaxID=2732161 RepID=A0A7Y3R7V7_9FLAO|nr:hypothetical protein [Flavobacterium sp. IMCC34852]NNT71456.1 hypothetical protein [Flavobacterium sp. IMCC34852]
MKFSQRLGITPVKDKIQIDSIDVDLLNSLWSVFLERFVKIMPNSSLGNFMNKLWFNFFKRPIDTLSIYSDGSISEDYVRKVLRSYFYDTKTQWYEIYDFLEFSAKFDPSNFIESINIILERENSAYRFVNSQLVQITSQLEIDEIEEAILKSDKFSSVKIHLNTALNFLSDRKKPDYRNSIKESISAVESICKIFTGNDKATLGEALKKLEQSYELHPALKKSFTSLYGYTSDDAGIRHALTENDRRIDFHEAKFILVTCSAFTNFLMSKM